LNVGITHIINYFPSTFLAILHIASINVFEASFEACTALLFQVEVVVKMEAAWTSKTLYSTTILHGITTQKTMTHYCLKAKSFILQTIHHLKSVPDKS
jgi:hypothetical protein